MVNTYFKRITTAVIWIIITASIALSQPQTTAFYPYVSNGEYAPGSFYEKFTIQVANPGQQPSSCGFYTMGVDNSTFQYSTSFVLDPNGGTFSLTSPGKTLPYAAGVGGVTCSSPVFSHLNYQIFNNADQLISFTSIQPVSLTIAAEFHYPDNESMLWVNVAYDRPGTYPTLFDVTLDDGSHAEAVLNLPGTFNNKFGNMVENIVSIPAGRKGISVKITSIRGVNSVTQFHPTGDGETKFISGALNALGFTYITNPPVPLL